MEKDAHKSRRDRIASLGASVTEMLDTNREGAQSYEQSGLIGRFIIRRRSPEVFEQYNKYQKARAIIAATESIQAAKRAGQADAATTWIY